MFHIWNYYPHMVQIYYFFLNYQIFFYFCEKILAMQNNNATTGFVQSESDDESIYKVPNLEKGLTIIELLSSRIDGLTFAEIQNHVNVAKTTAYRILSTLVRRDYLEFDEATKRYSISKKILAIGLSSIKEHNLTEIVLPEMQFLRDEIGESVFFGVLSNDGIVLIERSVGTHAFCFNIAPGNVITAPGSAPYKAMIAFMPKEQRNRLLNKMKFVKFNENTITTRKGYEEEIKRVKKQGFALDLEEELYGVICLSVPILNYSGVPCGCLWTSGPKDRLNSEELKRVGEIFLRYSKVISSKLGYHKEI